MEAFTKDSACFFTQQVFLIGTYNEDGSANFAPISWVSFTDGSPCCLIITISSKKRVKQTTSNIERTGLLSATVVTPDLLPFAERCNKATAREGAQQPPEVEAGKVLDVPLLKNTKWSYECKVVKTVQIGECTTFFAAFESINVRKDVQNLEFIDLREINPVLYSSDSYFLVGDYMGVIGDYADK